MGDNLKVRIDGGRTIDARRCTVNKRRNQDHVQNSDRRPTSMIKNIVQKEGGCVQEGDICPDTWVVIGNSTFCFPRLEMRKRRE